MVYKEILKKRNKLHDEIEGLKILQYDATGQQKTEVLKTVKKKLDEYNFYSNLLKSFKN